MFRRKGMKRRMIKSCKGAISILLCISLSPFISFAAMLVEMYRYQGEIEIAQEAVDSASLSTLASYDEYLQKRFGLFAISQDTDVSDVFSAYYSANMSLIGGGMDYSGTPLVTTINPLADTSVIESQLLDFSESTVLTEVLLADLNIEDLLAKLDSLGGIAEAAEKAEQAAELAKNIKSLVNAVTELKTYIETIPTMVTNIQNAQGKLTGDMENLYQTLYDQAYVYTPPEDGTEPDEISYFAEQYLYQVEILYSDAYNLVQSVDTLVTSLDNDLETKVGAVMSAYTTARTTLDKINGSSAGGSTASAGSSDAEQLAQKSTDESVSIMETLLNEFEEIITTELEALKEELINSIKEAATGFLNEIKASFKLDKYYSIISGEYFSSEEGREDLKIFVDLIPDTWPEDGAAWSELRTNIFNALKDAYLPEVLDLDSFENTLTNIKNMLETAIQNAEEALGDDIKEALTETLTKLVNAVKNLFSMEFLYDPELDAVLSEAPEDDNPYQNLWEAGQEICSSVENFKEALSDWSFLKALEAFADFIEAIGKVISAIKNGIAKITEKLAELVGYIKEPVNLYKQVLISGYATHNFPNRLNYNTGKALTGYSYSDIVYAQSTADKVDMFRGAELEYIVVGTQSEITNQSVTFIEIYVLRLLLDLAVIFTNKEVSAMAGAATIASWAVYLLVIVGEPLCDTLILVNGGTIPIIKSECFLTPSGIVSFGETLADLTVENATLREAIQGELEDIKTSEDKGNLNETKEDSQDSSWKEVEYSTYVLIVMLLTNTMEDILERIAYLVQLESASYYNSKGVSYEFSVSRAYTTVNVTAPLSINSMLAVFDMNDLQLDGLQLKRSVSY